MITAEHLYRTFQAAANPGREVMPFEEMPPIYREAWEAVVQAHPDRARLDWLQEHEKPTMVDGKAEGLAAVVAHHVDIPLRDAIDVMIEKDGGSKL